MHTAENQTGPGSQTGPVSGYQIAGTWESPISRSLLATTPAPAAVAAIGRRVRSVAPGLTANSIDILGRWRRPQVRAEAQWGDNLLSEWFRPLPPRLLREYDAGCQSEFVANGVRSFLLLGRHEIAGRRL